MRKLITEYDPLITHDVANPQGVSITPGNNTMGSWGTVWGTPLSGDYHLIQIFVNGIGSNAKITNALLDFGWDPAGGTNFGATARTLIPYLNVGYAGVTTLGGVSFLIPILIPSGSTLGARCQINNATVGTANVWAVVYKARNPRSARFGTQVVSYGEQTAVSRGVDVTFGGASEGAWTLIASAIAAPVPSFWLASTCHNNLSALSADYAFNTELAFGPNTTDLRSAGERWYESIIGSGEARGSHSRFVPCRPAAGSNIYVRGRAASATAYTTMVHGVIQ